MSHVGRRPPASRGVAEGAGQAFRLLEIAEDVREISRQKMRVAQFEANIDGLRQRLVRFRHVAQRYQRLLEACQGFAMGRARECPVPGLPEIAHGLFPSFSPERVLPQPLDVLH